MDKNAKILLLGVGGFRFWLCWLWPCWLLCRLLGVVRLRLYQFRVR